MMNKPDQNELMFEQIQRGLNYRNAFEKNEGKNNQAKWNELVSFVNNRGDVSSETNSELERIEKHCYKKMRSDDFSICDEVRNKRNA